MAERRMRPDLTGWWTSRSDPQRFDVYTRGSLYVLLLVEPFFVFGAVAGLPELSVAAARTLLFLSVVHLVAAVALLGPTITAARLRSTPPWRGLAALGLLSAGATVFGLQAAPGMTQDNQAAYFALVMPMIVLVLLLSVSTRPRVVTVLAVASSAGLTALVAAFGAESESLPSFAISLTLMTWGFGLAFWSSVWMLDIVWRLDEARTTASQLAVAEERLRFSRDLHDVMGRNLSVIAVRSQLAEQLALRGRDGAAEAMGEVRAIAEQSLREVREVVRGYRSTDLTVELTGARSVLRAASVDCRITGDAEGLSAQTQTVLGWVVREGVTNVIRHSQAQRCDIALRRTHDAVVLSIENDGVLPATDAELGSGLAGVAERLRSAGGRLQTHRDDSSFRLVATLPMTPAVAAGRETATTTTAAATTATTAGSAHADRAQPTSQGDGT